MNVDIQNQTIQQLTIFQDKVMTHTHDTNVRTQHDLQHLFNGKSEPCQKCAPAVLDFNKA